MGATKSTARSFAVPGFTSENGSPIPKERWAGMVEQHLLHIYSATDGSFEAADRDMNRISADLLLDGLDPSSAPAPCYTIEPELWGRALQSLKADRAVGSGGFCRGVAGCSTGRH